ncbi:MAG: sensor histidine kinase [Cytophagales bacterium CG18_big_fil_WC_8_21_14_2_50_42_9]|nr:MAG: sensor histidine kinase [Cytophagales bacterium CG18_big_fil_WC_8_21_14_2_50_42_9]
MQSFINRNRVLLLHLSFWGVYISFSLYQISMFNQRSENPDWSKSLIFFTIQIVFNILLAYLNYFILLPRWLARKQLGRYFLEFSVPFALLTMLRINLLRYLLDSNTNQFRFLNSAPFTIQLVLISLFIVVFVGMLRFAVDWFEFEARTKAIENEKLFAELNFLKAQINPHFLFNTLNNLYYLAYTQSPNTMEVIEKLSQMMRYMIYDTNGARVPLSKEITYMENYISLEKLRLNNEVPITFAVQGNIAGVLIVPLIFITFLENAFKHGVSNNNPQAWVKINITLQDKTCTYTVANSKIKRTDQAAEEKSGMGLQNVQRRLDLSYPNLYTLAVNETPDQYAVELKLTLA